MIAFKCTKCNHSYQVPDDYAGKKVRCKECKEINAVPAQKAGSETRECGDSLVAYNQLLQELLQCEKQALNGTG